MQATAPPSCKLKVVWIIIVLLQSKHKVPAFHPPPPQVSRNPPQRSRAHATYSGATWKQEKTDSSAAMFSWLFIVSVVEIVQVICMEW